MPATADYYCATAWKTLSIPWRQPRCQQKEQSYLMHKKGCSVIPSRLILRNFSPSKALKSISQEQSAQNNGKTQAKDFHFRSDFNLRYLWIWPRLENQPILVQLTLNRIMVISRANRVLHYTETRSYAGGTSMHSRYPAFRSLFELPPHLSGQSCIKLTRYIGGIRMYRPTERY